MFANTDTDIFVPTYRSPIPIFPFWPIPIQPISRTADTDTDTNMADTDILFADTDIYKYIG